MFLNAVGAIISKTILLPTGNSLPDNVITNGTLFNAVLQVRYYNYNFVLVIYCFGIPLKNNFLFGQNS